MKIYHFSHTAIANPYHYLSPDSLIEKIEKKID